jgi:hypothetical protein
MTRSRFAASFCAIDFVELPVERCEFWTAAALVSFSKSASLSLFGGTSNTSFLSDAVFEKPRQKEFEFQN